MLDCRPVTLALSSLLVAWTGLADEPAPLTSLANPNVQFTESERPYAVLKRGPVQVVIVDNQAVDDDILPGHRAGYSGVASWKLEAEQPSLFVPAYAGLNFEHILDGTIQERTILFEPRNAPMQLRLIDPMTVELYQPPTPHYGLESCTRYRLLDDSQGESGETRSSVIEMTFECIARRPTFSHDYIGLFWASYMHQPESLDIHFRGRKAGAATGSRWVRGITPEHGVESTHVGIQDQRQFPHAEDFPLKLVFNRSQYRYVEPWYFGVSHGRALAFMFRTRDQIRLTQSPSGGGSGNPAWDFQYLIPESKIGQRYQMVMRAMLVRYKSREQIEKATLPHRAMLNP